MRSLILFVAFAMCAFAAPHTACHSDTLSNFQKEDSVYICTGKYAQVYHRTPNCRGLNNCKGRIVKVSYEYAAKQLGRRACKVCE